MACSQEMPYNHCFSVLLQNGHSLWAACCPWRHLKIEKVLTISLTKARQNADAVLKIYELYSCRHTLPYSFIL
jgi:hypothetical protein